MVRWALHSLSPWVDPTTWPVTPAEVLVVRIEDDPRVFLGSRIASHEVDPAGKGLPRRSSCLELSGPHHWYKGSQPSPRSAVLSADTSVVLSTVAGSMTHSMLPSKTQSQSVRLRSDHPLRRCTFHAGCRWDLHLASTRRISLWPEGQSPRGCLLHHNTSTLHPLRASIEDILPRRLVTKLESVSATTTVGPSPQRDEAHTRLNQVVRCRHSQ